mmetsp:Transcript_17424/g.44178  ORF Transcript_17424/g.44178 Transcript_17424/m.44178 type:complete len:253 (+) Transcript_17424:597-1355(+)
MRGSNKRTRRRLAVHISRKLTDKIAKVDKVLLVLLFVDNLAANNLFVANSDSFPPCEFTRAALEMCRLPNRLLKLLPNLHLAVRKNSRKLNTLRFGHSLAAAVGPARVKRTLLVQPNCGTAGAPESKRGEDLRVHGGLAVAAIPPLAGWNKPPARPGCSRAWRCRYVLVFLELGKYILSFLSLFLLALQLLFFLRRWVKAPVPHVNKDRLCVLHRFVPFWLTAKLGPELEHDHFGGLLHVGAVPVGPETEGR